MFLDNITKQRQLEVRMKLLLGVEGAFVTTCSFIQQMFRQCLQCNKLRPGFGNGGRIGGGQRSLNLWSSQSSGKRKLIYKKTNKQINIILHITERQGEKPSKVVEKARRWGEAMLFPAGGRRGSSEVDL